MVQSSTVVLNPNGQFLDYASTAFSQRYVPRITSGATYRKQNTCLTQNLPATEPYSLNIFLTRVGDKIRFHFMCLEFFTLTSNKNSLHCAKSQFWEFPSKKLSRLQILTTAAVWLFRSLSVIQTKLEVVFISVTFIMTEIRQFTGLERWRSPH